MFSQNVQMSFSFIFNVCVLDVLQFRGVSHVNQKRANALEVQSVYQLNQLNKKEPAFLFE